MNKNELIKNLKKDIQDIYTKINEFELSEQIHLIDIDLALSKVRNLYELLSRLNSYTTYNSENQEKEISTKTKQLEEKQKVNVTEESNDTKTVTPDKVIIEPKEDIKVEERKEVKTGINEDINTEVEIETKVEHHPEFIIETETKTEIITDQESDFEIHKDIKPSGSPEIVADKFQSKKFVHDQLSKKNIKDVSSKLQSKPIKDINSAIGLNDKFIFIRELFGNDKDQYHETIQILNNFDTFENAVIFLNENFNWDDEDPNFERLKELVRRKYSAK